MSRHAPPPPPPPLVPRISDSESDDDYDVAHGLETNLVPSKDASIEGLFDESKVQALTYLDASVIMDTKLSDHIETASAFYNSYWIHALVVDKLQQVDNLHPQSNSEMEVDGTFTKAPSVETLHKVKQATMVSLTKGIAYCSAMIDRAKPWEMYKKKKFLAVKKRLQASQLYGEECEVWEGGRRVGMGRLSFGRFGGFMVGDSIFQWTEKEILASKCRIKKQEVSAEVIEEKGWEAVQGASKS